MGLTGRAEAAEASYDRGGRSGHPACGAAPGTAIARAGHAVTAHAAGGQHCDAPEWSGDDIELWGAGDPEGLANAAGSVQYAYEAAVKKLPLRGQKFNHGTRGGGAGTRARHILGASPQPFAAGPLHSTQLHKKVSSRKLVRPSAEARCQAL